VTRGTVLLLLAITPGAGFAARTRPIHAAFSWNRAITCTPFTATAADVLAGRVKPGIADPTSTTPPCEVQHRSPFVQLHAMRIIGGMGQACAEGDTEYCDTVFTAEDRIGSLAGQKPQRVRCVIDREWKRAAIAPPSPGPDDPVIEIQGYVHWDAAGQFWEIHPVTAWRTTPAPARH